MDPVFKALADPTRRALLDELFAHDGQTLAALTARHEMTRIAVAKHLRILEEAGLVVTRRRGREKLHFLNPVPIRLVHDRWVTKYTGQWAAGLAGLKHEQEEQVEERGTERASTEPDPERADSGRGAEREDTERVFEIYIRTTPERLWEAITDPVIRAKYHFGAAVESDWAEGSAYRLAHPAAPRPLVEGENLVVEPPRRLVQSMRALWGPAAEGAGTSRVTWEIEPVGDSCRLTVVHDQLPPDAPSEVYGGWPMILSGLKTWLETGTTLTTPGSLMYGGPAGHDSPGDTAGNQ